MLKKYKSKISAVLHVALLSSLLAIIGNILRVILKMGTFKAKMF